MVTLITTSGRPGKQVTLTSVPDATLVVQDHEYDKYRRCWPANKIVRLPPHINRLSPTRQWILENYTGKVCLLDDDLTFAVRRKDNPTKFRAAQPEDIKKMLACVSTMLNTHAHVGIANREGGCHNTEPTLHNTRHMRLLAYDMDVLRKLGVRFDRLTCMSDFDMTLQLLRAGYPNVLANDWCHNQSGSNTTGGCSKYRTLKVLAKSAQGLHDLHPAFVTVVEKTTKGAWGGGTRKDVRIAWKKAYNFSQIGE